VLVGWGALSRKVPLVEPKRNAAPIRRHNDFAVRAGDGVVFDRCAQLGCVERCSGRT